MPTLTKDEINDLRHNAKVAATIRDYDKRVAWRRKNGKVQYAAEQAVSNREAYETLITDEGDVEDTRLAAGIITSFDMVRDAYPTPDVTTVDDKSANIFWRGTTDIRTYRPEQKRTDTFYSPTGLKLYPSFDKYGNRLIRHFDTGDSNYTFRISVRHNARGEWLQIDLFYNVRRNGKWQGRPVLDTYKVAYPYSDLAEQRVTYWMMAKLSRI